MDSIKYVIIRSTTPQTTANDMPPPSDPIVIPVPADPPPQPPPEVEKAESTDKPVKKSSINGEPGTGYEGPEKGAFNCWNCEYAGELGTLCKQEDMMKRSKRPKLEDGRVLIHPMGCCEYIERVGKFEDYDDFLVDHEYDEDHD